MYAERSQTTRFNPGGLAAAIAINAAFVAALIFLAPHTLPGHRDTGIEGYNVPLDEPPPREPEKKAVELKPNTPTERLVASDPYVRTSPTIDLGETTIDPQPPVGPIIGIDPGPVVIDPPLPPAPLPYVDASVDPRYADALQPAYPPGERRAAREGRVTVRVLIGFDGRVKQAQQVAATSEAFWRATLDQAMRKWRFRPATRGGVPVEAWRTMTLRFELRD